jgi:hypothetical protein
MSRAFHIVGKDLRRLRWWLLVWTGVLALPIFLAVDALRWGPSIGEFWNPHEVAVGLEVFVAYLLTIVLIQEDALVGTRQFWLTRPISGRQLLAAKTLGAMAILGVLPVAVSLPWWLWCGFGVSEIAVAALEWCACATLVALPAALMAALTDSLGRALLWSMVLVAIVPVAGIFFGVVSVQHSMGPMISRSVLAVVTVAVEMAIVILVLYRVRSRGRWLFGAGAVMGGTLIVASQWPWVWIGRKAPEEFNAARGAAVSVKFQRAWAGESWRESTSSELDVVRSIQTQFTATGVPPEMMLMGGGAEQRWGFGDAFELRWSDHLHDIGVSRLRLAGLRESRWHFFSNDEETRRWMEEESARKKRAPDRQPPPEGEAELETWAHFRPSLVARMQKEPPSYEARLWLELLRPELGMEVPLAQGRWHTQGGRGMRIGSVAAVERVPASNELTSEARTRLNIVETRPAPITGMLRAVAETGVWFLQPWSEEREGYVLLNRARGEFRFVGRWGAHHDDTRRELVVNGVRIQWIQLDTAPPQIVRHGKWVSESGWSSDLTLGRVIMRQEAVLARDVKVERLELKK